MTADVSHSAIPLAPRIADWVVSQRDRSLPDDVVTACANTFIDTAGLIVAARKTNYVNAALTAMSGSGPCHVLGQESTFDASGAALINGVAAHGEDFDNTFEGCPVHWGAVVVPAVLAAAEAHGLSGRQLMEGMAVGSEIMCRLGLVVKKGVHTAGFHPTGVLGTMAATAGVASARRVPAEVTVNALGIAGSLAGGIIEYLADGTWTKRLHAGWAAQNGIRAVDLACAGFTGPATVFEGQHGLLHGFAPSIEPDFEILDSDLGEHWHTSRTAFKPYACGTMAQPFVDCAVRLSERVAKQTVESLICSVGEGTVHRLWEPIAEKRSPPNGYAAKFSTPYCVAVGFATGEAGLAEFTDERVLDEALLDIASLVSYEIDPENEYPRNYTGRIRAKLRDGTVVEESQDCLRGGAQMPMTRDDLLAKCASNLRYGDADPQAALRLAQLTDALAGSDEVIRMTDLSWEGSE